MARWRRLSARPPTTGRLSNCSPRKAGWMKSSITSQCRTRQRGWHNELMAKCLDHYKAGVGGLFHVPARLRLHRDIPAVMRVLHVLRGALPGGGRGVAGAAFLRLASVVLLVSRAGGGDALVGRRAPRGHH